MGERLSWGFLKGSIEEDRKGYSPSLSVSGRFVSGACEAVNGEKIGKVGGGELFM